MKEGIDQAKKDKEKEIKTLGVKPKIGYLLRMTAKIAILSIDEESKQLFSKFLLKKEEGEKLQENSESIKLYLNICYSERVLKPLNKTGALLTNIEVSLI